MSIAFAEDIAEDVNETHPTASIQWSRVTPLLSRPKWLIDSLKSVFRIALLADNWDGYGSPRISPCAIEKAISLLTSLEIENPPAPSVGPVPGGGLQFEWSVRACELEVEILPDGSVEFLLSTSTGEMNSGRLSRNVIDKTRTLVGWLLEQA